MVAVCDNIPISLPFQMIVQNIHASISYSFPMKPILLQEQWPVLGQEPPASYFTILFSALYRLFVMAWVCWNTQYCHVKNPGFAPQPYGHAWPDAEWEKVILNLCGHSGTQAKVRWTCCMAWKIVAVLAHGFPFKEKVYVIIVGR